MTKARLQRTAAALAAVHVLIVAASFGATHPHGALGKGYGIQLDAPSATASLVVEPPQSPIVFSA